MMTNDPLSKYLAQLNSLRTVASESAQRMVNDDPLFINHANVFAKGYLIMLCSILEAYLKEEVLNYVQEIQSLLDVIQVSKNLITWGIVPKQDELYKKIVGNNISDLTLNIDDKVVDDCLSANVDKTIATLRRCGVNIQQCEAFTQNKALIASIVTKRNTTVHHNDVASDYSFSDIVCWIDEISLYMKGINAFILKKRETNAFHLQKLTGSNEDSL